MIGTAKLEKENAAPGGMGAASWNAKGTNLLIECCHKRRARATGLFIWDRASNSYQTFASVQEVLA